MALQDSDNFIIGRGTDSYKITYEDLKDDLNYVPTPALEVGKGSISPSVDVTEGDTVAGSASVTGGVNPVVTHVFELGGVEVQRGTSAIYVTEGPGDLRYRVEASDDTFRISVIGEWSEAVNVEAAIDDTVPNATMHGLRFDKDRSTHLLSPGINPTNPWTCSFWVKLTSNGAAVVIGNEGGNYVYWDSSNWRVSEVVIPGSTNKLNSWQHVVATGNATHVNLWLDGVKITTDDGVALRW